MAYNSTHTGAEIDAGITKAQGVETGATANAADAQLRDRSTHTGTQDAATITGLADVATSGGYGDLTGVPATFTPEAHTHTLANITDAGTAAALDSGDFASATHTHSLSDISDSGSAAGSDAGDFATAAQGSRADTALQPSDNLSTLTNDAQYVPSDPTGITGAGQIMNMVSLTQAKYDAIGTPDASTFYVITG